MVFAPISFVNSLFTVLFHWLEEVWQDTVNLHLEIVELRKDIGRIEAMLVHMQHKDRKRDLAVQHAILREANALATRRLQQFQTLAPDEGHAMQKCLDQALHEMKIADDKISEV
jgi:hypothetical protein